MLFVTIQLYRFCSCAYFTNIFLKTQIKRYGYVFLNFSLNLGQVQKHTFTYDEDSPVIIACK